MADKTVGIIDQSTSTVAPIDVAQITRGDGSVADRQRIVLADSSRPDLAVDELYFRTARQFGEVELLARTYETINQSIRRHGERAAFADRRGGFGRGSVR